MGCAYLCLQICSIEGMDVVDRPFRDIVVEYVSRGDHPSATAQTIVSVKLLTAICCVWCVCLCVRVCACVCFNSIASGPRPLRVGVLSKRCPSVQLLTSEWNRRRYNSLSRADFLSTLFHEVRAVTLLVPHWSGVLCSPPLPVAVTTASRFGCSLRAHVASGSCPLCSRQCGRGVWRTWSRCWSNNGASSGTPAPARPCCTQPGSCRRCIFSNKTTWWVAAVLGEQG